MGVGRGVAWGVGCGVGWTKAVAGALARDSIKRNRKRLGARAGGCNTLSNNNPTIIVRWASREMVKQRNIRTFRP